MRGCIITAFMPLLLAGCGLTTLIAGPPFEVGDPDAAIQAETADPALDAAAPASDVFARLDEGGSVDSSAAPDASAPSHESGAPPETSADAGDAAYADEPYIPPGDLACVAQAPCGPYTVTGPVEFCVLFADGGAEVRPSPVANSMCADYLCSDWTLPCDGRCTDSTLGWPVVKIMCR
jgi:hypothetical protein